MDLIEIVKEKLNQLIDNTEVFLVDLTVSESKIRKKIVIYLDTNDGILIDKCGEISRELGDALDEVILDAYILEVSSPGADSPLKFERQYLRNIGRTLKIIDLEGIEYKGRLLSIENSEIMVQPERKKKIEQETLKFKIENIKEAKVVLSFK